MEILDQIKDKAFLIKHSFDTITYFEIYLYGHKIMQCRNFNEAVQMWSNMVSDKFLT